jgi:gamma-F420-2:alpha-L-glutamate ligase
MQGWILNRFPQHALRPDSYGVHRLLAQAQQKNIVIRVVAPHELDIIAEGQGRHRFLLAGQAVAQPNFLLNRMGSATSYFALAVMRQMENAGVYVPNSSQSVALVRDKLHTLQVLAQHGLPIAKSMLAKYPVNVDLVERELGFPVIVKTLAGSQGRGVFLCETRHKFEDLIAMITTSQGNPNFIIQQFIVQSMGQDLRVFVIGGRVVGCMVRKAAVGSFKANYSQGGTVLAYPVTPLIEQLAVRTAKVLGLEIAGVDLLFADQGFKVCEANSSPGFRGLEECSSVNISAEILNHIELRLEDGKFANQVQTNDCETPLPA